MEKSKTGQDFNTEFNKLPYGQGLCVHCCCAPCSSAVLLQLAKKFKLFLFFYNPNLDSVEENEKRLKDLQEFVKKINQKLTIIQNAFEIVVIDAGYDSAEFYNAIKGKESCPEGGERCEICYSIRIKKAIEWANQNNIKYVATSLTLSPPKSAEKINKIGIELSEGSAKYLRSNFKKKDGYLNSIKISKLYNLYRQNYCGCVFSKSSKEGQKLI